MMPLHPNCCVSIRSDFTDRGGTLCSSGEGGEPERWPNFLVTQRRGDQLEPTTDELYTFGTTHTSNKRSIYLMEI